MYFYKEYFEEVIKGYVAEYVDMWLPLVNDSIDINAYKDSLTVIRVRGGNYSGGSYLAKHYKKECIPYMNINLTDYYYLYKWDTKLYEDHIVINSAITNKIDDITYTEEFEKTDLYKYLKKPLNKRDPKVAAALHVIRDYKEGILTRAYGQEASEAMFKKASGVTLNLSISKKPRKPISTKAKSNLTKFLNEL